MKRHGFGGQPASHGQSLMHRGMGSAGGSQGSGSRVLPGKRMAGNMGNERVTVKNLKVLQVDEVNGILVVNGKSPFRTIKQECHLLRAIQLTEGRLCPWPQEPNHQSARCDWQAVAEGPDDDTRYCARFNCSRCRRGCGYRMNVAFCTVENVS